MASDRQRKVAARNRRQRVRALELRMHAIEHRRVRQAIAKLKIARARKRIEAQVARSRRMGLRAKRRAEHIGESARERARR